MNQMPPPTGIWLLAIRHPNAVFLTALPGLSTDWHNLPQNSWDPAKIAG